MMQPLTVPPTVSIHNLTFAYQGRILFENLDFCLPANQWTCLLGPSGVGKTSLLRILTGLIETKHAIRCDNNYPLFKQVAYMAQTDLLLPWLSAWDNALLTERLGKSFSPDLHERGEILFTQLGLTEHAKKFPHELSGGMRQRVALARTFLQDKPVVLMDEPFSALDVITRLQLQTLARTLLKNRTVLCVTHDPLEALRLADDIYILSGQPVQLTHHLHCSLPFPRDPADSFILSEQAKLLQALLLAKEKTS